MTWAIIWEFLKKAWPVILIAAGYLIVAALMHASFNEGKRQADEAWQKKETQARLERAQTIREIERAAESRQAEIAREYERELGDLKRLHEDEIDSILQRDRTELRDTVRGVRADGAEHNGVQCPTAAKPDNRAGLPKAGKTARGLACYTEDQLRRKIAASVAIGQECDREMIRFQKLIEACGKE